MKQVFECVRLKKYFAYQALQFSLQFFLLTCLSANAFAASIRVDSFTIADEEHDWTIPFHNDLDSLPTTPLTLRQSIPIIISPNGPAAQKFNAVAKIFALQLWNQAGGPSLEAPLDDDVLDLDLKYTPNLNSIGKIISLKFIVGIFARDSQRGNEIFGNLNYNIEKGRLVDVSDLFDINQDWCPALTSKSVAVLQNNSNGNLPELFGQSLEDVSLQMQNWACDPRRWIITAKGLEIDYGLEEVGSYMAGTPSTLLTWSALKNILNPAASKILLKP